jgi:O-antigen ligase
VDGRFERWKYSAELFLEYPIFGAGTGDVDALRTVKFRENNDIIGFKNKFNAHNQFLELLSGQGLLGGAWFLLAFYFLIKNAYINKEYLYLYILSGIFFCCLTESMFRVSWGIVFFSIMSSLAITTFVTSKRNIET